MKNLSSFGLTLLMLTLIVAIVLTLVAVPATPVPWVLIGVLALLPFVHQKLMARRFLQWDDRYSVGIQAIDDDHRRLLNLANQFQTAADYATDPGFEREAFEALVDYTKTHFGREEKLMEEYGYPDFEAHKREHRSMIAKVDELKARYDKAPAETVNEAVGFLKNWLINHIGKVDQQYASFFKNKGVT